MSNDLDSLLMRLEREILALKTTQMKPAMFKLSSRTIQVSNYSPGASIGVWEFDIVFDGQSEPPLTFKSTQEVEIIAPSYIDQSIFVPTRRADVEIGAFANGRQKLWITFDTTPSNYNGSVTICSTGKIANIVRAS